MAFTQSVRSGDWRLGIGRVAGRCATAYRAWRGAPRCRSCLLQRQVGRAAHLAVQTSRSQPTETVPRHEQTADRWLTSARRARRGRDVRPSVRPAETQRSQRLQHRRELANGARSARGDAGAAWRPQMATGAVERRAGGWPISAPKNGSEFFNLRAAPKAINPGSVWQ